MLRSTAYTALKWLDITADDVVAAVIQVFQVVLSEIKARVS